MAFTNPLYPTAGTSMDNALIAAVTGQFSSSVLHADGTSVTLLEPVEGYAYRLAYSQLFVSTGSSNEAGSIVEFALREPAGEAGNFFVDMPCPIGDGRIWSPLNVILPSNTGIEVQSQEITSNPLYRISVAYSLVPVGSYANGGIIIP